MKYSIKYIEYPFPKFIGKNLFEFSFYCLIENAPHFFGLEDQLLNTNYEGEFIKKYDA